MCIIVGNDGNSYLFQKMQCLLYYQGDFGSTCTWKENREVDIMDSLLPMVDEVKQKNGSFTPSSLLSWSVIGTPLPVVKLAALDGHGNNNYLVMS